MPPRASGFAPKMSVVEISGTCAHCRKPATGGSAPKGNNVIDRITFRRAAQPGAIQRCDDVY
jgi:hypothetical protein